LNKYIVDIVHVVLDMSIMHVYVNALHNVGQLSKYFMYKVKFITGHLLPRDAL